jgi:16S rRNA processing protein RimM
MEAKFIQIGKIVKAHGIKGEVVAIFYSDSQKNILNYKKFYIKGSQEINIKFISKPNLVVTNDTNTNQIKFIITINNISDKNQTQNFINEKLYIEKSEIQKLEDEFLVSDLLDLKVYKYNNGITDEFIGSIKDIHDFGGGTIAEIDSDIKEFQTFPMYHFDNESFPVMDLDNKKIYLSVDPNSIETLENDEIEIPEETISKLSESWDRYTKGKKRK